MTKFLPDTSVMIAAVCSWHEHHEAAASEFERRLSRREALLIAAPAVIETYAVLTRLPTPHRISASDARALIEENFLDQGQLVALDKANCPRLVREVSSQGVVGGRTYDFAIATCAIKTRATVLLTFNERDFQSMNLAGLQIQVPAP